MTKNPSQPKGVENDAPSTFGLVWPWS